MAIVFYAIATSLIIFTGNHWLEILGLNEEPANLAYQYMLIRTVGLFFITIGYVISGTLICYKQNTIVLKYAVTLAVTNISLNLLLVRGFQMGIEGIEAFTQVCERLRNNGAQAVILGCTEIPMLMANITIGDLELLSTTDLHCQYIVNAIT